MELQLSVKQMLLDIITIIPQLKRLYSRNEKYKAIIQFLDTNDFYNKEDVPYPTLKVIEKATGLKPHAIRKLITEMYYGIYDYENDFTFDFGKTEVIFTAEAYKNCGIFKTNNLEHLPRVGENLKLPFLKAKTGTDLFYVQSIHHTFDNDKQLIDVRLKNGFYNSYWHYRLDKAFETGEIGYGEPYKLYDYQLKQRLGLRG